MTVAGAEFVLMGIQLIKSTEHSTTYILPASPRTESVAPFPACFAKLIWGAFVPGTDAPG